MELPDCSWRALSKLTGCGRGTCKSRVSELVSDGMADLEETKSGRTFLRLRRFRSSDEERDYPLFESDGRPYLDLSSYKAARISFAAFCVFCKIAWGERLKDASDAFNDPKTNWRAGTETDWKAARRFCEKWLAPDPNTGRREYADLGWSRRAMSKKMRMSATTVREVVAYGECVAKWFRVERKKVCVAAPGAAEGFGGGEVPEGYTYYYKGFLWKVFANRFVPRESAVAPLKGKNPKFLRKIPEDVLAKRRSEKDARRRIWQYSWTAISEGARSWRDFVGSGRLTPEWRKIAADGGADFEKIFESALSAKNRRRAGAARSAPGNGPKSDIEIAGSPGAYSGGDLARADVPIADFKPPRRSGAGRFESRSRCMSASEFKRRYGLAA